MSTFCASCTDEATDLESVMLDERRVLMCGACREEHPRSGRWSFEGGRVEHGAHGVGEGNRALGRRGATGERFR